jgi:16S rRNA G966 N2-methylase RsmD
VPATWLATKDVPLADLERFPGNARRGNVGEIRKSIKRHGQYRSLVVRSHDGKLTILAGNHTRDALEAEGFDGARCEIIECDDAEARRINAADNRLGELPDPETGERYDGDALAELLGSFEGDFDGTGWTEEDLADLLAEGEPDPVGGGGDPDDSPEPPAEPVSAHGDLYLLGPHRLLCGDATNPDDLKRVTDGHGEIGIVYTDPPYGIKAVPKDGGASRGGRFRGKSGTGDFISPNIYSPVAGDDSTETVRDSFGLLTAEYPHAAHVWWGGNHFAASAGLPDATCWLVWDKDNTGDFADAELAWTSHHGPVRLLRHMWNGMLRASERGKRVHPTQKPVALAEWAFTVMDPKNERKTVLDVFGGSGSTLIAAHRTKRTAAVVEMEPAYVDVIARRYEEATQDIPLRVLPDGGTVPVSFT